MTEQAAETPEKSAGDTNATPRSTAKAPRGDRMRELVRELEWRKAEAREMGGAEKVEKQHGLSKLTCRERIDHWTRGSPCPDQQRRGRAPNGSRPGSDRAR